MSSEELLALADRNLAALADPEHQRRAAEWREKRDAEERWRAMGFEVDGRHQRRGG